MQKLPPADYVIRKNRMSNGLLKAEGWITKKEEESRTFTIMIINIRDCDVNLCDGTVLSTAETITIVDAHVVCEDFGKEIRDNVSKFLKKDVSQGDILENDVVSKSNYKDKEIIECNRSLQACIQEKLNN